MLGPSEKHPGTREKLGQFTSNTNPLADVSSLETYALGHASRADDMKYLSHILSPILASWLPSNLLIIWFLIHITCLRENMSGHANQEYLVPWKLYFS